METTREWVLGQLPRRHSDANKGSFGRVVALAGSFAYRGAAALCVEGALRTGAGLVYLASVEPVLQLVLTRTPECCALPCTTGPEGCAAPDDAARLCGPLVGPRSVLLAGPGLGAGAAATLEAVLRQDWPAAVLDADALNALAAGCTPQLPPQTVLTPHPGEMARLMGCTVAEVQADRPGMARRCARERGCVVVLKGSGTLIAAPDGRLCINRTGNPGLSRGGSGDVLAGMLAALMAQGMPAYEAAASAVWLHGAAADRCAARSSMMTMLPHELLQDLAGIVRDIEQ